MARNYIKRACIACMLVVGLVPVIAQEASDDFEMDLENMSRTLKINNFLSRDLESNPCAKYVQAQEVQYLPGQ